VPLRGGQTSEHRILHRGIRSGTRLERLESNDDTGYTRVRLETGLEGWIQSQYLSEDPIAKTQLSSARAELKKLNTANDGLRQQFQDLQSDYSLAISSNANLQDENKDLKQELDNITQLASSVIAIDEENNALKGEHESLLREIDFLASANQDLNDNSNQQWFLRGSATVLISLLAGFWISRRIYHKRSNTDWA
jgi:SH3 domain protein